jgi:asparagine synthase (glutamine-hydrolysing)
MNPNNALISVRNPYRPWALCESLSAHGLGPTIVWVRGQAWFGDRHLEGKEFADWLCDRLSGKEVDAGLLAEMLCTLNGSFALIAQTPSRTLAAVDKTRSIPLFYGLHRDCVLVSDSAVGVRDFVGGPSMDDLAAKEFLLTGYATGAETLYRDVLQLQAGELITVTNTQTPEVKNTRYYRFLHGDYFDDSDEQLHTHLEDTLWEVFDRLAQSVRGQRIVVPLSGGLDSRLVVVMLKLMGIRNVLCYTYGRRADWEVEISRKVAHRLGFEWVFVPYSRQRWKTWFSSEERKAYFDYASNLVSSPHLQDWPAVWELNKARVLRTGDVIVPGHTGDFVSGGHVPHVLLDTDRLALDTVIDLILEKHYILWGWTSARGKLYEALADRVSDRLEISTVSNYTDAASAFETWEWQERQAKFIVNSVRAYEFWGYDWRMPLWDSGMMEFWSRVPLAWRMGKKLYDSHMETQLFPKVGVENLNPSVSSGLASKLSAKAGEFTNPSLGRYSLSEWLNTWRDYHQRFGNGYGSRHFYRNPNTFNASIFLRSMGPVRGTE